MSEKASSALLWSTDWTRKRKPQPVPTSKKLRSKIPRKKRSQVSPILIRDDGFSKRPALEADSSSSSCFPGEISAWISDGLSNVNKKQRSVRAKKRIGDVRGVEVELQRRPITRLYLRRKQSELEAKKRGFEDAGVELSESSCVESSIGVASGVPVKLREVSDSKLKLKDEREEGIDLNVIVASDAISLSEASCVQQGKAPIVFEEGEFAEKTSKPDVVVDFTEFLENEASTSTLLQPHSVAIDGGVQVSYEEGSRAQALSFSEISQNYLESNEAGKSFEITVDQKPNDLDMEYSLACSEDLSYEESPEYYSTSHELSLSQYESELFPKSSDLGFSDFSPSMLIDSLNDSSQLSDGDSPAPLYFPFFLQYQKQLFHFNSFDTEATPLPKEFYDEFTLLRFENDEEEQTYRLFRSRERKLLLDDYKEKYSSTTEFGDVVLRQRHVMIDWIVNQSEALELQSETMFLGVSLLDRFLSRGFFKHKRKLQILGISCLALATRIEENQPYNSVRQSAFYVGKKAYSKSEVIGMEWLVQEVLNFQCFLPTIYNFLGFYLKVAKASAEVEKRAKYLAVLSLLDYERLCYWPSTVAAGLVILASLAANQESSCQSVMETHVRTKNDDLPECIQCLEWLVKHVN